MSKRQQEIVPATNITITMTTHDTILSPAPEQSQITHDEVISKVYREIELHGLKEAYWRFMALDGYNYDKPGWPQIRHEVEDIFIELKRKEKEPLPPPPQPQIPQTINNDNRQITMMGGNTIYNEDIKKAL